MSRAEFKKKLLSGNISVLHEWFFIIFISMLCMLVFISSDVFLPFLPEMTGYFKTSFSLSQMTLTVFMIGLACAQIPHGLLSDRFGRKPVLNIMLPIFLISTMGCILAWRIEFLIFCRLFQAISASACIVIGRSLFSDLFEPLKAQRAFAVLIPLVSLSPALAPSIGGFLSIYFPWQASFIFVFIFGLFVSFFVFLYLPESRPREKRMKSLNFKVIFQSFYSMLSDLKLLYYIVIISVSTGTWWIYVSGAPLMFHRLGYSPVIIGLLYFPAVLPYFTTSFMARAMLKSKPTQSILSLGMTCFLIGTMMLLIFNLLGLLNIWTLMFGVILITASNGFMVSTAMSAGILLFSKQSGLVSGLLGTLQLLAGAISAALVGVFSDKFDEHYFAWMSFTMMVIGYIFYHILKRMIFKKL